ncbi:MAG: hypothetical protein H8E30_11645 [Alphaproteobacteria bacterium]|nr:hypothetical protein [Alphaproteobacteria bacterium]
MTRSIRIGAFAGNIVVAITLFAMGACTNSATISRDYQYSFYDRDLVQYVASKESFPVLVVANAFGAGADDALLAGLKLPGYYPPTPFTATTAQARNDGHLILVFDPIGASSGQATCDAPETQTMPAKSGAANTVSLLAAFCYGREAVSVAYMEIPRPAGPADQAFRADMAQLLAVLLPSQRQDDGGCAQIAGVFC